MRRSGSLVEEGITGGKSWRLCLALVPSLFPFSGCCSSTREGQPFFLPHSSQPASLSKCMGSWKETRVHGTSQRGTEAMNSSNSLSPSVGHFVRDIKSNLHFISYCRSLTCRLLVAVFHLLPDDRKLQTLVHKETLAQIFYLVTGYSFHWNNETNSQFRWKDLWVGTNLFSSFLLATNGQIVSLSELQFS